MLTARLSPFGSNRPTAAVRGLDHAGKLHTATQPGKPIKPQQQNALDQALAEHTDAPSEAPPAVDLAGLLSVLNQEAAEEDGDV